MVTDRQTDGRIDRLTDIATERLFTLKCRVAQQATEKKKKRDEKSEKKRKENEMRLGRDPFKPSEDEMKMADLKIADLSGG